MDRALLSYAINHGYNDSDNDPEKVEEISGFDSEKKCATVKLKNGLVYWKGATENIIDKVTHYMLPDGEEREFTKADKDKVEEQMHAQAKRTMKLLSVAKTQRWKAVLWQFCVCVIMSEQMRLRLFRFSMMQESR